MRFLVLLLVASLSSLSLSAQSDPDPKDFEKVFFPVFFFGDGAFGAQWETRAVVFNDSERTVALPRSILEGDPSCPAVCGCGSRSDILPKETNRICESLAWPGGVVLYAPKEIASELHFSLRVRDISRSANSAGTEVAVVRERDLRNRIILPDVPVGPDFRTTLRIFDVAARDGIQVRMQVFGQESPTVLVDRVITLDQPIRHIQPEPFPSYTAYAVLNEIGLVFPPVVGLQSTVRIEITPLDRETTYWAVASTTNNATQEVTIVNPQ